MTLLHDARIVLAVSGGIAAYKAADLASILTQAGATVETILTRSAQEFVRPLTFSALTRRPVHADPFEAWTEAVAGHITLAHDADVLLVAPATANTIARLALGLADDVWPDALSAVGPMLAEIGDQVDLLEHRIATWGDLSHRRFFAQYRNGVQVDLVALPVSARPGMPVGSIALYDPDGRLQKTLTSRLERASAENVREWAFLGWIALANLDKYLRRGSTWEGFEQLHEARTQLWRLSAVASRAAYPAFGLTSVLDQSPPTIPGGPEQTVATLAPNDLRRAAIALASLLERISAGAAEAVGGAVPDAMAGFVSQRLAEGDAQTNG